MSNDDLMKLMEKAITTDYTDFNFISVLGAFDTWTYMDYICRKIASTDEYMAYTSRKYYFLDPSKNKTIVEKTDIDIDLNMNDFLLNSLIKPSNKSVIVYSVPAGHYNEAHWCSEIKQNTLGLVFVREIEYDGGKCCKNLVINKKKGYAYCKAKCPWNAWNCIEAKKCPFKEQQVAKNQIEYFICNDFMNIYAVECLENLDNVLLPFINK